MSAAKTIVENYLRSSTRPTNHTTSSAACSSRPSHCPPDGSIRAASDWWLVSMIIRMDANVISGNLEIPCGEAFRQKRNASLFREIWEDIARSRSAQLFVPCNGLAKFLVLFFPQCKGRRFSLYWPSDCLAASNVKASGDGAPSYQIGPTLAVFKRIAERNHGRIRQMT
jgi:hypothetical protein